VARSAVALALVCSELGHSQPGQDNLAFLFRISPTGQVLAGEEDHGQADVLAIPVTPKEEKSELTASTGKLNPVVYLFEHIKKSVYS
jgi:hypothetical protein